jgi:hypothetical protein
MAASSARRSGRFILNLAAGVRPSWIANVFIRSISHNQRRACGSSSTTRDTLPRLSSRQPDQRRLSWLRPGHVAATRRAAFADLTCIVAPMAGQLDEVRMVTEQLEPERARSCRNAITMASVMVDEIRLRAYARPLDEPEP